ncbi:MAG: hypothetical protein LLG20_18335 [Acidobacteriales bacterium]|nr:hypothetical protein [Terriglobales bacterium]
MGSLPRSAANIVAKFSSPAPPVTRWLLAWRYALSTCARAGIAELLASAWMDTQAWVEASTGSRMKVSH